MEDMAGNTHPSNTDLDLLNLLFFFFFTNRDGRGRLDSLAM